MPNTLDLTEELIKDTNLLITSTKTLIDGRELSIEDYRKLKEQHRKFVTPSPTPGPDIAEQLRKQLEQVRKQLKGVESERDALQRNFTEVQKELEDLREQLNDAPLRGSISDCFRTDNLRGRLEAVKPEQPEEVSLEDQASFTKREKEWKDALQIAQNIEERLSSIDKRCGKELKKDHEQLQKVRSQLLEWETEAFEEARDRVRTGPDDDATTDQRKQIDFTGTDGTCHTVHLCGDAVGSDDLFIKHFRTLKSELSDRKTENEDLKQKNSHLVASLTMKKSELKDTKIKLEKCRK